MDNKYFYYSNNGKLFTNKISALQYLNTYNIPIYFYYHDDVFNKVDWGKDVNSSLSELYIEQAKRIRDSYDYVILFYSGGEDSTNILETFHYNNILLDKIVCVGSFSQDADSNDDSNHNGEIYKNCIPYLKYLSLLEKTQFCDYSKYFDNIHNFSVTTYDSDWISEQGGWYSPHHWFWRDIEKHVIPANMWDKRVALIWGKDKTYITKTINTSFSFKDTPCLGYGTHSTKSNHDRINFYWDPKFTKILQKQTYCLKHIPGFKLYDLKYPIIYRSPKSPTNILSLRDSFLVKHKTSDIYKFYSTGILNLSTKIDIRKRIIIPSREYII